MIQKYHKSSRRILLIAIVSISITLVIAINNLSAVLAQTTEQGWSTPENLSKSGSTTNPIILVDLEGTLHVLWEDAFLGYVYTKFDGEEWSPPEAVNLPFIAMQPQLIVDPRGQIHAFWINLEANDLVGELLYSQVSAASITNADSWTAPRILAELVAAVKGAVDAQGEIHVGFIAPFETDGLAPGTYYIRSDGNVWSVPEVLYNSPYMRSLTTKDASIDVTTSSEGDVNNVFIAWDNRPRQRLLFIKSADGGDSWNAVKEIVVPEVRAGASIPHNLMVNADGDNVVVIWQVGQPDLLCTQHFNWSPDGGETWGESDQMIKDIFGCPQNNQFIPGYDDLTLLFTTIDERVYLLAWDGSQWSNPQPQPPLFSFTDPDTLNDVIFSCRQAVRTEEDHLTIIGCDANPFGDIWLVTRPIGDLTDWFPLPSAWSEPSRLFDEGASSLYGKVFVDGKGTSHVIWNQLNDASNQNAGLYYSFWSGTGWNTPTLISKSTSMIDEKPLTGIDFTRSTLCNLVRRAIGGITN